MCVQQQIMQAIIAILQSKIAGQVLQGCQAINYFMVVKYCTKISNNNIAHVFVAVLPAVAVAAISISYSILLCVMFHQFQHTRCIPLEPPIHFGSTQNHYCTRLKPLIFCASISRYNFTFTKYFF